MAKYTPLTPLERGMKNALLSFCVPEAWQSVVAKLET